MSMNQKEQVGNLVACRTCGGSTFDDGERPLVCHCGATIERLTVNLIQLPGAPAPGYRYVCQKCNEVLKQQDVEIDGNGGLIHQADVDCTGDPPQWKAIWCGPVHQEPFHDVENCADPRCEDAACRRQREYEAGERRADALRDAEDLR